MGRVFELKNVSELLTLGVDRGAIGQIERNLGGAEFTYYWPHGGEALAKTTSLAVESLLVKGSGPVVVRVQDNYAVVRQKGSAAAVILRAVEQRG